MNLHKMVKWWPRGRFRRRRDRTGPRAVADELEAASAASKPKVSPQEAESETIAAGPEARPRRRISSKKQTRQRTTSRQGIRIIAPDENLARSFHAAEQAKKAGLEDEGSADDKAAFGHKARRTKGRPPEGPPSAPPRNRVGIRQLEHDADLWGHFLGAQDNGDESPRILSDPSPSRRRPIRHVPQADIPTDRHGIPRLDDHVDLHRFFEGAVDDVAEDDLGAVFSQSLQHDARGLMKQKSGGRWAPRRLTLKEQLRRYPRPQAQLDLHGATAVGARQRAESFLRTAAADGLLTLRLIVGKGLHSEDGAVLPDAIEDLLVALKKEPLVLTFHWEKGLKRKSGAVIVYLRPPF